MKGLITPLRVVPDRHGDDWDGNTFRLIDDMIYETKSGVIITVPKGFKTNFANWIRPTGTFVEAAVIHDYLYDSKMFTRKQADKIFKEAMVRGGSSRLRVNLFYYGVRLFGKFYYKD